MVLRSAPSLRALTMQKAARCSKEAKLQEEHTAKGRRRARGRRHLRSDDEDETRSKTSSVPVKTEDKASSFIRWTGRPWDRGIPHPALVLVAPPEATSSATTDTPDPTRGARPYQDRKLRRNVMAFGCRLSQRTSHRPAPHDQVPQNLEVDSHLCRTFPRSARSTLAQTLD